MSFHTSVININENALRYNLQRVRQIAPRTKVLAMVKANAYGHGLITVAKALQGADALGVACLAEVQHLRDAGIQNRIVLMRGVLTPEELAISHQYRAELVIHQWQQLELLEQQTINLPQVIWLKVNTGMNRLGILPQAVAEAFLRLKQLSNKPTVQLLTHFACADELTNPMTAQQIQLFSECTQTISAEKSLANSAGILAWPESHADWVRPGLMLYGVSPFTDKTGNTYGLSPVMSWQSELIAVRLQQVGDKIGYGGTWRCADEGNIGVVSVGYADGYPRHANNGTPVLVNGERVTLVGRVSMDMLTVDLQQQPHAKCGDLVTLWGEGLPIEEVALHTASNAYELLCNAKVRT